MAYGIGENVEGMEGFPLSEWMPSESTSSFVRHTAPGSIGRFAIMQVPKPLDDQRNVPTYLLGNVWTNGRPYTLPEMSRIHESLSISSTCTYLGYPLAQVRAILSVPKYRYPNISPPIEFSGQQAV